LGKLLLNWGSRRGADFPRIEEWLSVDWKEGKKIGRSRETALCAFFRKRWAGGGEEEEGERDKGEKTRKESQRAGFLG